VGERLSGKLRIADSYGTSRKISSFYSHVVRVLILPFETASGRVLRVGAFE
jgi:hypothetical protein